MRTLLADTRMRCNITDFLRNFGVTGGRSRLDGDSPLNRDARALLARADGADVHTAQRRALAPSCTTPPTSSSMLRRARHVRVHG
jgi:hypothetical protein